MYYHLSNKPVKKIVNKKQLVNNFKPQGIWYAKNNIWQEFVDREEMDYKKYNYRYKLDVFHTSLDTPNKFSVLLISNNKNFNLFLQKYSHIIKPFGSVHTNWKKVSEDFGGIEIKNIQKLKMSNKTLEIIDPNKLFHIFQTKKL